MVLALIVFLLVMLTTLGAATLLSRKMHRRDVDQLKDRLAGKTRTSRALKQTQLIKSDDPENRSLTERLLGGDLETRLREYIEQGGLQWEPARVLHMSLF